MPFPAAAWTKIGKTTISKLPRFVNGLVRQYQDSRFVLKKNPFNLNGMSGFFVFMESRRLPPDFRGQTVPFRTGIRLVR
jgi:hypothetical protein